jgi:hypothetical protein
MFSLFLKPDFRNIQIPTTVTPEVDSFSMLMGRGQDLCLQVSDINHMYVAQIIVYNNVINL